MKFSTDILLLAIVYVASSTPFVSAQPPPHARGQVKKFEVTGDGNADIELYEGGPSIKCAMHPGRGAKGNPQVCRYGTTTVATIETDCDGAPGNGDGKKCFAASITEGETGRVYYVNRRGEVTEREQADYPPEEDPPNEDAPPEEYSARRSLLRGTRDLQGTNVIDILVVYTQGAKADAANYADGPIEDLVALAIVETNQAYVNSGIDNVELNLIALHEDTSYTADVGSTSMAPSLYHLSYTAGNANDPNGELDYVHQMRNDVGADMVALITTGAGCGIAWLGGNCESCFPSASSMFSVTKYSCATGYYSFAHELGHNMVSDPSAVVLILFVCALCVIQISVSKHVYV